MNVGVEATVPRLREILKKVGLEKKNGRQILHLLLVEKYIVEKPLHSG